VTSLAQVKAAINAVISQINEQNGLINDFKSTNRDNMTLVTSTLQGGQAGQHHNAPYQEAFEFVHNNNTPIQQT